MPTEIDQAATKNEMMMFVFEFVKRVILTYAHTFIQTALEQEEEDFARHSSRRSSAMNSESGQSRERSSIMITAVDLKKKYLIDLEKNLDYMPAGKLYTIYKKLAVGLKERIQLAQCGESLDISKHFAPVILKIVDFVKNNLKLPEPLPSDPNQLPAIGSHPVFQIYLKSK
jgi:hypothetical protein